MPQPLIANLPLDLVLASGYVIRFTALDPTTGAAVTGVRVTDIAFQVRPVNIGPGGETDGVAPLPLLVPSSDTAGDTTPAPTGSGSSAPTPASGPLHTQAAAVTDPPVKAFAQAVADNLEPASVTAGVLPSGARPFHQLANAIIDVGIHLWAVAVADKLEA